MKTEEERKELKNLLSKNIEHQTKKVKTLSVLMDYEFTKIKNKNGFGI